MTEAVSRPQLLGMSKGPVASQIEKQLMQSLDPVHLEILNESDQHAGPPGRESHFKVTVVSASFQGKSKVAQSRLVYAALGTLLSGPVHALALHTYTPDEWSRGLSPAESPSCQGSHKG